MGWELHGAKSEFQRFAEDWDRINSELYDSHPYFDSRFVGPLLTHFASGEELLCLYRDKNESISGALILQPQGRGRWMSFRPSQAQITAVLLRDASPLLDLFKSLPGFVWAIELIAIDPRYAPNFMHRKIASIVAAQAHTIGIHPNISFNDYWQNRPKKLKSNIQRYFNRIEKEFGASVFQKNTNPEEMNIGVARFGELEMAGWKGAEGTAISIDNVQGAFYSEVMRQFATTGHASVYELQIADRLAASRLIIENQKMAVCLKTSYDETLSHVAPGRIMLNLVIEDKLNNQPEQTIEFYTNATQDQRQWSTFDCTIQSVSLLRNSFCANAFAVAKMVLQRIRGKMRRKTEEDSSHASLNEVMVFSSVKAIREAGHNLDEFVPTDSIETSIDWFDLLHDKVFTSDAGVRFYLATKNQKPQTILPLHLVKRGKVNVIESLGNYYTSLYEPLCSRESGLENLQELLAQATRDQHGAHVMRFAPMDPESPAYATFMNELRAIGWVPFSFFCFGNWYLKVNDGWEAYLKERSANLRSNIKRRNKRFLAEGGSLEVVTRPEEVEKAIEVFQEVYAASWKIPEPYPNFVPSLIRQLSLTGMLRLGIARLQEKPIAAQLWIVGQKKASIYKVAYHEQFSSFSPGTILTSHLLQHVIEKDQVTEVDFLIGDDEYKKIWMSDFRERWGIIAYNPRTCIGSALLLKELLGRAVKHVGGKIKNTFHADENTAAMK